MIQWFRRYSGYFVFGLVSTGWALFLFREFQALPVQSELKSYLIFQIELLAMFLFVMISILILLRHEPPQAVREPERPAVRQASEPVAVVVETSLKPQPFLRELLLEDNPENRYAAFVDLLRSLIPAGRITLYVYQKNTGQWLLKASAGRRMTSPGETLSLENMQSLDAQVIATGKRLFITNIETHPEVQKPNNPVYQTKSCMIIPVYSRDKEMAALLNFSDKESDGGIYLQEDLKQAEAMAALFGQLL